MTKKERNVAVDRHIGAQLRDLREARGVSPEKLANILSISLERYAAYELGRQSISARHLYDLSVFFAVPVTYFFENYEGTSLSSCDNGKNSPETNGGK